MLPTLKTIAKAILGRDLIYRRDIDCAVLLLGSDYEGWRVAEGILDKNSVVYSFGIGTDASFDLALIARYGLAVHAFDPTPQSIAWVKHSRLPEAFILHEYGLAARDGGVAFRPPENPTHVSHRLMTEEEYEPRDVRLPVKKLTTIMRELGHERIDLLKMDIEGAEYDVIEDLAKSSIRPKQILVEFHHRFPGISVATTRKSINTLRSMGYALFSVSRSNRELSFILRA
ncbi:MAG: FkbM family methyltransferase [Chthoniobacterales bacterium]|nr:FkbM family methyltransferase [Chthoniobacterales bacterium]